MLKVKQTLLALKDKLEQEKLIAQALTLDDQQRAQFITEINDVDLREHIEGIINEQKNITQFFHENSKNNNTDEGNNSSDLKAGSKINRITIEKLLGKGGMGSVYQGYDEKLKRKVAIKSIRSEYLSVASTHQRFIREAQILSKINHPSICHIYDYIETDSRDYLVLELVQGKQLNQVYLDYDVLLKTLLDLAKALEAAHKHGIVHRDLKPDNIMITDDNKVKVLDFGIAQSINKPVTNQSNNKINESSELTQQGSLVGTIRYMSPEQARGETITTASDIYSLGVIIQELFSHESAYEETETIELLASVQTGQTASFTSTFKPIKNLVKQLCQLDPEKRPSASEVCKAINQLIMAPKIKRKRIIQAATIFLAVSLIAVLFWQWQQSQFQKNSADLAKSYTNSINKLVRESEQIYVLPLHNTQLEIADVIERGAALFNQIETDRLLTEKDRLQLQGLIFLESEDFQSAVDYLERSQAESYLLARAWIGLYIEKTSEYSDINGISQALESQELRDKYLKPAINYINSSTQSDAVHEAFKVALTESLDAGLYLLDEIIQAQSWDKRAIQLKTQILLTQAEKAVQEGKWSQAKELYLQTITTFEQAIDMARSYPDSYLGLCEVNGVMLFDALQRTGQDFVDYSNIAVQSCEEFLIANPNSNYAINLLARIHVITAQAHIFYDQDPSKSIESAQYWVDKSQDKDTNFTSLWTQALLLTIQAKNDVNKGLSSDVIIKQAIALYKKAILFAPNQTYIISDLIYANGLLAEIALRNNNDIVSIISESEIFFNQALKSPSIFTYEKRSLYQNMGTLYFIELSQDFLSNINITEKGQSLLDFFDEANQQLSQESNLLLDKSAVHLLMAQSQFYETDKAITHLNSTRIILKDIQKINAANPDLLPIKLWYVSLNTLIYQSDDTMVLSAFEKALKTYPKNTEINYLWANHDFLILQQTDELEKKTRLKQSVLSKLQKILIKDPTNRYYLNLQAKLELDENQ
ncbi:MAG: serine/threonine-protein kinase [Marinicellaceae bacterium]